MFRKLILTAIIALLASTFAFSSTQPAKAAFSGLNVSVGCSSISVSGTTDAPFNFGGLKVGVQAANITKGAYLGIVYLPVSGSGPTYTFSGTLNFASTASPDDQIIYQVYDAYTAPTVFTTCKQTPGPGAPAGFAQKTIICNTPIYSQVDGDPVSGTALKVGQVFYVNPTAVVGKQRSWTEIFAGSYTNGYVPTACVK